jgi:hypothetical protein
MTLGGQWEACMMRRPSLKGTRDSSKIPATLSRRRRDWTWAAGHLAIPRTREEIAAIFPL